MMSVTVVDLKPPWCLVSLRVLCSKRPWEIVDWHKLGRSSHHRVLIVPETPSINLTFSFGTVEVRTSVNMTKRPSSLVWKSLLVHVSSVQGRTINRNTTQLSFQWDHPGLSLTRQVVILSVDRNPLSRHLDVSKKSHWWRKLNFLILQQAPLTCRGSRVELYVCREK